LVNNLLNFRQFQRDWSGPDKWKVVYPILRPDARIPTIWIEGDFGNIVVAVIDYWGDDSYKAKLTKEPILSGQMVVDATK